ncbi:MAG: sigma-70 family RNA polymerase sigma factor [Aggregatilineales bacterium]
MDNSTQILSDENEIIVRSLTDISAFAVLYDYYAPRVYTYIRYRVNDINTADDLTAQTFEKALSSLPNYQPTRSAFSAWLFGIAHHVVTRHYRTRQRQQWFSLDGFLSHQSDISSPEDTAIRNEINNQLLHAVKQLPARERDLIALKFATGLTNREIARITGFSESNVGVIVYRAIKKLREKLSESRD